MDGGSYVFGLEDPDVSALIFATADLATLACLDQLGLVVTGQQIGRGRAVLALRVVELRDWCQGCGCQGRVRDRCAAGWLAHERFGWRPTTQLVTLPHKGHGKQRLPRRRATTAEAATVMRACVTRVRASGFEMLLTFLDEDGADRPESPVQDGAG